MCIVCLLIWRRCSNETGASERHSKQTPSQPRWALQLGDVVVMSSWLFYCNQCHPFLWLQKASVNKRRVVKTSTAKSSFAQFRAGLKKKKDDACASDVKTFDAGFFSVSSPIRDSAAAAVNDRRQSTSQQSLRQRSSPRLSSPASSLRLTSTRSSPRLNSPLLRTTPKRRSLLQSVLAKSAAKSRDVKSTAKSRDATLVSQQASPDFQIPPVG